MSDINYYQILGVKETATAKQIKTAFRRLVRQYHPDVSSDANADEMIAKINNAYEVLSDPDKKAEYDKRRAVRFAHRFNAHRFKQEATRFTKSKPSFYWEEMKAKFGEDSPFASSSVNFDDLFANFTNKNRTARASEKTQNSTGNNTTGHTRHKNQHDAHPQNQSVDSDFDSLFKYANTENSLCGEHQHVDITIDLESVFIADSYMLKLSIPTRQKNGTIIHEEKNINLTIPKGITEGMKIRLAEKGAASLAGGKNGDLYLKVAINTQPHITLDGSDIYQEVTVMPWQAALGADIHVDSPAGTFTLTVPKHSQTNDMLRLKGKGIPSATAGDLFIILNIVNPTITTTQQKEAFQHLKEVFGN